MTLLSTRREVGEFKKRYKWMAAVVVAMFVVLFGRLLHLQLIEHDKWAAEARANITKRLRLPATRGLIYDAQSRVVASNRASYEVYVTPQLLDAEDIDKIAQLMALSPEAEEAFEAELAEVPARRRSHLIQAFRDVTRDQFAALETHKRELPGVEVITVPLRTYPYESLGAHTVGYINEVNAEDLERLKDRGYRAGQHIGRKGIEKVWESKLRGKDGELTLVVDVRGREYRGGRRLRRKAHQREPVPGSDVVLTLDMDLMRTAQRAFRGHPSGGVVVVDVRTGRLRVLYSKPAYDPNRIVAGIGQEEYEEIKANPFRPLIDKTAYESYFPGSTFKPFSALAALQDEIIDTSTRVECPGYYELGRRKFRCSHAHGDTDMRKALVQSCNVYFYRLAEQVGLDRLARFARDFGLGSVTGLGVDSEARGFIPTREWYKKRHADQYRLGWTLNTAVGQGDTRVTLVQLALAYAAMANGGTLYYPQLVERVQRPDGEVLVDFTPRVRRRVSVEPEHLAFLIDSLYGAVNDPKGTAYEERLEDGVPVAGKTGTAQVAKRALPAGEDPKRAWYYRRSHAWFAGFAPAADPKLAVVVLVEHGGRGGKYAAPIAMQVLKEALGDTGKTMVSAGRGE